jgi:D-psicose/D-tagatose/L-ribulose 3-epimerase
MLYGAHSYLFTNRWSDEEIGILDAVAGLGLDWFEIAVGDDVPFTIPLTRRRAEELGLELTISPGGKWPIECDLSSDSRPERMAGLDWHKRQVNLASELGAVAYAGALYGHPGIVKKRPPTEEENRWIAEALGDLAEYAEPKGVAIVLEPMSHFRTHVVNKPEQATNLINLADRNNLFVLLDTYHMVTEIRDYARAIRSVRERLWGMHLCENDRGVPGSGLVPWSAVLSTLAEIHFQGHVGFESYNSSIPGFAYERGMFHDVCPDGSAFVRESLAFIQREIALHSNRPEEKSP